MSYQDLSIEPSAAIAIMGTGGSWEETGDAWIRGWLARFKGWPTSYPMTGVANRPVVPARWTLHQDVPPVRDPVTFATTPAQWVIAKDGAWLDPSAALLAQGLFEMAIAAGAKVPPNALSTGVASAGEGPGAPSLGYGFSPMTAAMQIDLSLSPTVGVALAGGGAVASFGPPIGAGTFGAANLYRLVLFGSNTIIINHNPPAISLPTGSAITAQAGDIAAFMSDSSGRWTCVGWQRADGTALVEGIAGISPNSITRAMLIKAAPNTVLANLSPVAGNSADATMPALAEALATDGIALATLKNAVGAGSGSGSGSALPPNAHGVLENDGGGSLTWVTPPTALPANPGTAGFLGNNGAGLLYWANPPSPLPGNAAGFLQNDGAGHLSWGNPTSGTPTGPHTALTFAMSQGAPAVPPTLSSVNQVTGEVTVAGSGLPGFISYAVITAHTAGTYAVVANGTITGFSGGANGGNYIWAVGDTINILGTGNVTITRLV